MSSSYGETIRFTLFGQSHGPVVGVTMEGVPPGFPIDLEALQAFLNRRAPGRSPTATARREEDRPEFLSGLVGNVTCGAPLTAVIPNRDIHPQDYRSLRDCPRPGHGDYTAQAKFHGAQDAAGGGHLSGRLTAPLCIAGGICLQLLAREGVTAEHVLKEARRAADGYLKQGLAWNRRLERLPAPLWAALGAVVASAGWLGWLFLL